jgi:thioredoxin-related protein
MKRILSMMSLLLITIHLACAGDKTKAEEIQWLSFEEAEAKMKKEPRKVLIDFYTGWCGWCKVMDKKTYAQPDLVKYVNEHFYAIKFDAEQKDPVQFMGKKWEFQNQYRAHELAIELMQGRMSYPTTVIMDEHFTNAQPMPGYLEVYKMESILKYIAGDQHKSTPWNDWQRSFKAEWGSTQ